MKPLSFVLIISSVITMLVSCVPVVVGTAATGGAMAADRRTSGVYIEDENIELKILKEVEINLTDASHINITSFKGNVLLSGEVPDSATKSKATKLAKSIISVRSVNNELVVGQKSSLSERLADTYLTSKVKAKFISENRFPANYVKIVTEAKIVYLLGYVTQKEARDASDIASKVDGVKKVVTLFEYIPH